MTLPTASKLGLAMQCLHPWAWKSWPDEPPGDDDRMGHAVHRAICHAILTGEKDERRLIEQVLSEEDMDHESWHLKISAFRPLTRALEIAEAHPVARPEVAYAWDAETMQAREIGVDIGRSYRQHGATDSDVCGSADVVWVESDPLSGERTAVVRDWKCGSGRHLAAAEDSWQLRFLAMCAAQIMDADKARVEIARLWPGGISIEPKTYEAFDLVVAGRILKRRLDALAGSRHVDAARLSVSVDRGSMDPCPGPHCSAGYCPVVALCPATAKAMKELVPAAEAPEAWTMQIGAVSDVVSEAHAAWILHRMAAVDRALEDVRGFLKAWVGAHGPIDLGDGSEWGPATIEWETIASDQWDRLAAVLGAHAPEAMPLLRAMVGKSELKDAVMAATPKGQKERRFGDVMDELRKAGVVRVSSKIVHDARKRK